MNSLVAESLLPWAFSSINSSTLHSVQPALIEQLSDNFRTPDITFLFSLEFPMPCLIVEKQTLLESLKNIHFHLQSVTDDTAKDQLVFFLWVALGISHWFA